MSKPNLIVMAYSEPWCSAISRNFPNCRQSWVLSVSDLIDESHRLHGSAAIVEIPQNAPDDFFLELSEISNNSFQLQLFAVGDTRLLDWQPVLRAVGVAAWYWSLLQLPSLVEAIARHHRSVDSVCQPTETKVWSELPWPTAETGG